MPATTRTAQDAASAIGCTVGQIVKSLVFQGIESGKPYLILASGPNRVNEASFGVLAGESIQRAKPDFVRECTGFAIGGVPPLGHSSRLPTWMDEELFVYETVWAAAGTPESVFAIAPKDLASATIATIIRL
ncbi:MAG TPA: YbaK/EbsC family protein [Terracidiphilus sp.]|nr:YbaK/EbsC family protein [Terracidiphilus sp.]